MIIAIILMFLPIIILILLDIISKKLSHPRTKIKWLHPTPSWKLSCLRTISSPMEMYRQKVQPNGEGQIGIYVFL